MCLSGVCICKRFNLMGKKKKKQPRKKNKNLDFMEPMELAFCRSAEGTFWSWKL